MNTITRKPKRAKGAVLIMVLTIMTVLILLLAGTISVVYSSHNRALKKYTESQAYYTARSVIDEYISGLLEDDDTSKPAKLSGANRKYNYLGDDGSGNTIVKNDKDMTQGRALELDLYRVPVSTDTNTASPYYNEWFKKEIVDKYSSSMSAAEYTKFVNITSSDLSTTYSNYYKQFTTGAWPTTAAGAPDTLTYKVSSLDAYGTDIATSQKIGVVADGGSVSKIYVQVLERKFDLGSGSTFEEKFNAGDRQKDYFKLKVTSEVMYQGEAFTTSAIINTSMQDAPAASNAIVSLSNIRGNDTVTAFGGASSLSRNTGTAWTNNANTSSNIFFQGDVNTGNTTPKFYLNSNNILFVRGTLSIRNSTDFSMVQKGATFFAKTIDLVNNNAKLGRSGAPINVIADRVIIRDKAQETYAQVVADEFDYFVTSNTNGASTLKDNAYCKFLGLPKDKGICFNYSGAGTFEFAVHYNNYQGTAAISDMNADFAQSVTGGTIAVYDGYAIYDGDTPLYRADLRNDKLYKWNSATNKWDVDLGCTLIQPHVDPLCSAITEVYATAGSSTFSVLYDDPAPTIADRCYDMTTDFRREFTLPVQLIVKSGASSNKITVDTVMSLYGEYFVDSVAAGTGITYPGDTWKKVAKSSTDLTTTEDGDFNLTDAQVNNDTIVEAFCAEHVIKAEDIAENHFDKFNSNTLLQGRDTAYEATFPPTKQIPAAYTRIIGKQGSNGNDNVTLPLNFGTVAVDVRKNDCYVFFGTGTGGEIVGNLVVFGDKTCYVNLPTNAGTSNVVYSFGSGGSPFSMWDYDLGDLKPSTINIEGKSPATPAPNIKINVGKECTKLTCTQQTPCIQGYVYAPSAQFELGGGNNGYTPTINTSYASGICHNSISVIGSVFCKGYGGSQKPGVCFIDPSVHSIDEGQKLFTWQVVRRQMK